MKTLVVVLILGVISELAMSQIIPQNLGRVVQVADSTGTLPEPRNLLAWDSTGLVIRTSSEGTFKILGDTPAGTSLDHLNLRNRFGAPSGHDGYEIRYTDSSRYWIGTNTNGTGGTLAANLVPFSVFHVGARKGGDTAATGGIRLALQVRDENGDGLYTPGERLYVFGDMVLPLDSVYDNVSSNAVNPFAFHTAYFGRFRTGHASVPDDATSFDPATQGYLPPRGTVLRLVATTADTAVPVISSVTLSGATGSVLLYSVTTYSYAPVTLGMLSGPPGATLQGSQITWCVDEYVGTQQPILLEATNVHGTAWRSTILPARVSRVRTDTNNLWIITGNDGVIAFDNAAGNFGLSFKSSPEWPLFFAGGMLVAGKNQAGGIICSKSLFESEFQPGRILAGGLPPVLLPVENPDTAYVSIYRLPENSGTWPSDAPRDVHGDPLLVSQTDTWAVFNDVDTNRHQVSAGDIRKPLGIQLERQTFQYTASSMANAVIVRMRLINRSNETYDSVYVSFWSDPDVGSSATSDLVASDTLTGMAYIYNSPSSAEPYWAAGIQLLQGVVAASPGGQDSLLVLRSSGFMRVPLANAHVLGATSMASYPGGVSQPDNDREFYHVMRGLDIHGNPKPGGPFAMDTLPADWRVMVNSGPFTLAAGDTQEMYYAFLGAQGSSHEEAADILKAQAVALERIFAANLIVDVPGVYRSPRFFGLYGNYPNPFNSTTTIRFSIPETRKTSLIVYNVLGQKVRTLIHGRVDAGSQRVIWDGMDDAGHSVASGVYICRLKSGSQSQSRKMILAK